MTETAYRALAALLEYPSEELLAHLDEIGAALAPLGEAAQRALAPLLADLAGADLLDAQERYVDTFDRGRRTSLNLFEHVHGDSRDRGQAMVDLLAMYREAGLAPATEQLPDYLPAFLEYVSLLPEPTARERLADIAHILQAIGTALAGRGSPYRGVFDVLLALAGAAPIGEHAGGGDDDCSHAALDAAWREEPVTFLDAAPPCGAGAQTAAQTIQIHRRPR